MPFRPKGGEIICFKADGVKSQDWRSDGHRWINQGTVGLPRSNPKVKKKYFYIANESGGASKDLIVESIRDNKFITERHGTYDNTSRVDIGLSRAEEIIANEMISFSPKMHTFTILGNNGNPNAVTVFPTEFCSCNAKDCLHLLAVKKSLGMDVTKKRVTNLTTLRGKDRKKKSGRKRPREGDYDYDVTPAPNSTVVNSEIDIETEPGVNVNDISMSGAEWIKIGKVILKDEEKKILESPNEWLNDRIIKVALYKLSTEIRKLVGAIG